MWQAGSGRREGETLSKATTSAEYVIFVPTLLLLLVLQAAAAARPKNRLIRTSGGGEEDEDGGDGRGGRRCDAPLHGDDGTAGITMILLLLIRPRGHFVIFFRFCAQTLLAHSLGTVAAVLACYSERSPHRSR